ncbi:MULTISPECIES: hypothetical protein [unclassified Bordetella]|uniref:hypothetical protein n=1 Tax=unclassified Bordetella TaxID=2630031 RepID=UPI00132A33E2|nr:MULTISPECIES: hypothetical protein [unclassified Bordetella]MVW71061.1 hypothetical protein [Bordetella sp. 15P40C-2]MVW80630.1 hypothetical protein [Bordetella sp. 02P26C-1]
MNSSTTPQPTDSRETPPWGYTHPDCKGSSAFLFFVSDLARVVNEALSGRALDNASMTVAQDAVDALVQKYIDIEAAPAAFRGQRILLKLEPAQGGRGPQVALQMSPELEDQIIEAQRLAQHQSALKQ